MKDITVEELRRKLDGRPIGVVGKRKEFAVLIPLIEEDGEVKLLFEVRSKDIRQPGDVCFPGGKIEEGESETEAALREMAEETGVGPEYVEVLGRFDSVLEVNRIRMHTAVGLMKEGWREQLDPDGEVAEIFTVPLKFFKETEPDYYKGRIIQDTEGFPYEKHGINPEYMWRDAWQDIFFWHWEGHTIWGLTAAIVQWMTEVLL
ncbi:MAG: CoA pyrophosphatase [Firmicutes bacterium]|nr:CoA pyrophosphatase [Bacillota bacterium]